jgi:hypothetical protein
LADSFVTAFATSAATAAAAAASIHTRCCHCCNCAMLCTHEACGEHLPTSKCTC